VNKKILVYDNQSAYFELLKTTFLDNFEFTLTGFDVVENAESEYDMILFFVYDEIEFLDFVKCFTEDVPFGLGLSGKNMPLESLVSGNIQYLNLDKLKNELMADVENLLKGIK
jgi:hypothetical protein